MKYRNYIIHGKVVLTNKLITLLHKKLKIKHYVRDYLKGDLIINLKQALEKEKVVKLCNDIDNNLIVTLSN